MKEREAGSGTNWAAWLRKAESDWLNIGNNLAAPRVPWDTVCFHAHQATEKTLKALIVQRGRQPRRTTPRTSSSPPRPMRAA